MATKRARKSAKKKAAKKKTAKKTAKKSARASSPLMPWETEGAAPRFADHRIAFSGKLEYLRKPELSKVLKAEGAKLDASPNANTTMIVFAAKAKAKAMALAKKHPTLVAVEEDEFRRRHLVATSKQAAAMLRTPTGRKRLAALIALNCKPHFSTPEEFAEVEVERADFSGASLDGVSLAGVAFIGCKLGRASLKRVTQLGEAEKSDFRGATIHAKAIGYSKGCDFRGATLKAQRVSDLEDCRLDDADLSKSTITDLTACKLTNATLEGATLHYSSVVGCSFDDADLTKAKLKSVTSERCSFRRTELAKAKLAEVELIGCDLRDAVFDGAKLTSCTFIECDLRGADFTGATVSNCTFERSQEDKAIGLAAPKPAGRALAVLEKAAPTFKKLEVHVTLNTGRKKRKCTLYQFNHGKYPPADFQSWLDDKDMGRQSIASSIRVIADLHPSATLEEDSLVVKSSKGKKAPALKPKALKQAVLDAWSEALS